MIFLALFNSGANIDSLVALSLSNSLILLLVCHIFRTILAFIKLVVVFAIIVSNNDFVRIMVSFSCRILQLVYSLSLR